MSPAQTVPADQATAADQHPPAQQEPKTGQDKKKRHVHWAALALSAALLIVAAASALAGVLLLHSHTASRLASVPGQTDSSVGSDSMKASLTADPAERL